MAGNTIMTAKNTFGDGLIMDFAPDNTQATCLTHALNATLLTMNGNELSLQNDMGNGRVETAYLPEGYVPVGTCEFGDIIYIVSYNPITNKSQIGCFPSPERNISSKELSGIKTTFNLEEFTKSTKFGFRETISNSVKRVIYDNKLNPGDKFIVHSGDIHDNISRISDYGNKSHIIGAFPKQFKINVVAIEDSGKINYLNSDLKWYDDFYINQESTRNSNKPDIDSYRNILSSGYSVFQSKVSGKLAILIELERIQNFSSTYEVLKSSAKQTDSIEPTNVNFQQYDIYVNFNWQTNNLDVNPKSIIIYDFKWASNSGDANKAGQYYVTGDKVVNVAPLPEIPTTDETKKYIELEITGQANTENYSEFLNSNYQKLSDNYKGHTKITQLVQNGVPIEGKYYLDLHHIVDGVYYNNEGKPLGVGDVEEVKDCIVNNHFKSSITKKGFTINIPDTDSKGNKIDKRDLILSFKVAPMMEYGVLSDLVQTHYIDFSKIGSGEINLEGYKYYIGENLCTLQIDSSIYPEDNKGVAEIEVQFYDNQGLCAKYFINNLVSYSGIITEYIPLNGNSSNYKLSKQDGKKLIPHAGQMFIEGNIPKNVNTTLSYVYLLKTDKLKPIEVTYDKEKDIFYKVDDPDKQEVTISSTSPIFYNDAGTLYSNMLYAVKIIYKYTSKNVLGEYNTEDSKGFKFEWRWLWTNTMFNQYYYNVKDFKDNQFELTLDIGAQYYANFKTKDIIGYEGPQNDTSDVFKGLGLNLNYINNGEIQYTADLGLQNTYNSFSLKKGSSTDNIPINIYSGNSYIQIQNDIQNNEYLRQSNDNIAPNNISKKYEYIIKRQSTDMSGIANPWESNDAYKNYKPLFTSTLDSEQTLDTIEYIGNDLKSYNSSLGVKSTLKKLYTKQSLKINLVNPTLYIKTYINQATTHKEMINLIQKGYEEYGLTLEGNSFNFNYVYSLWANRSGDDGKDKQRYIVKWNQSKTLNDINNAAGDLDYFKRDDAKEVWDEINKMAKMAELWQIRKAYGTSQHSIWKSSEDYFLREGKYDVNSSASFDLPNGFFINLLNFGTNQTNQTYISKTNDTNNAFRDRIFSDSSGFTNNTIYAQLAFNYGGDIHLLNDYINISAKGNNIQLKTALQDLASKWAGWLANTYILNQSNVVSSLQLNELIYSNSITTFIKDIVYCTKVASNNSQLLLNNYDYSIYLDQIQKYSGNISNSNVTIQFNNVTKNIPIQIQLKSLIPVRPQQSQNITIKPFANKTFDNVYISNISAGNLYCIQNDTMIPINNNQEIQTLTSYTESNVVFSENKCKFSIPKTFMYQDGSLVPKKSSSAGIQLYSQKFTGSGWDGAIKDLLISDTILVDAKHIK